MVTVLVSSEEALAEVEMIGRVSRVSEVTETVRVMESFQNLIEGRRKGYWIPPVSQVDGNHFVICKFIPTKITYTRFASELSEERVSYEIAR